MKKILVTVLIIIGFLGTNCAYSTNLSQNTLAKIVEKQVIAQHSKIDGELTAKVLLLPFKNMIIPEGKMTVDVECSDTNFSPKKYVNIVIKVDNKQVRKFPTTVMLTLKKEVWVAIENTARDKSLNRANFVLEKRDITQNYSLVLDKNKDISKYIALRDIKSGTVLDKRFVALIPDINKDSLVSIIFESQGVNIAIDGTSSQDGRIGDFIRVYSDKYKKYYVGKIISPNKVLVKI